MPELTMSQATEESVREISALLQEPQWLRDFRISSLASFRKIPAELSSLYAKYVDFTGVDLESISSRLPTPSNARTEDVLSKLRSDRAITLYQVESKTIIPEIPEALRKEGVVFTDIQTALRDYPELVRRYFLEKTILPQDDKFAALNNALFTAGFFLHVPERIEITVPLRYVTVFDSEGSGLFAQNLTMADRRSKFTVLEEDYSTRLTGLASSTYSSLSEVHLRDGADVTYTSINNLANNVNIFMNKKSIGEKDSRIVWSSGLLGGAYTRSRVESVMKGEGASSENFEVVFGANSQRFDAVSNISQIGPNTSGHGVSKGVVKDKARLLFKGMIRIEKNAKNSRAYLAEHGMILGKEARVKTIPGLEIETNEVKATHSASVTQLNDEQVFYLMSRGLSEVEAKKLMIVGFFEPLVERISVPEVARRLRRIIDLKWSGTYDFAASLKTPALDDEYYEEGRKTQDLFEGHYKYR